MKSKFKNIIIGNGPAGLLLFDSLKSSLKNDTIIIGKNYLGGLKPVSINSQQINLLPIFPTGDIGLFKLNGVSKPINITNRFREEKQPDFSCREKTTICKDSYFDFLNSKGVGDDIKTLSYKLYGNKIFTNSLNLVRDKVNRHYYNGIKKSRYGFFDGKSPLYYYLNNRSFSSFVKEQNTISRINLSNKYVELESGSIFYYEKLISTIDINQFIKLSCLNEVTEFLGCSACFAIVSSQKDLPYNTLYYDFRFHSTIYRAYIGANRLLIVQLSKITEGSNDAICQNLKELVNIEWDLKVEHRFHLKTAYPTDVYDNQKFESLKKDLGKNVFFFGRFGSWEYKDLDELNWSKAYDFLSN